VTRRAFALLWSAAPLWAAAGKPLTRVDEGNYRKLLAAHKGKVLLVDFWATWCSPCLEELPLLADMQKRLGPKGFQLVTISCDEPEAEEQAAATLEKFQVSGTAYLKEAADDGKFIDLVDPKWRGALPALFLYDRQGKLTGSFIGETKMATLEAAIRRLL
jgi:thiol-disulfide isomerase/thioredoxin